MKTVEYKLASVEGRTSQLPEKAVELGDNIMKKIKASKDSVELYKMIQEDPALEGLVITEFFLRRANYLRHSNGESIRARTFKDRLYIDLARKELFKGKGEPPMGKDDPFYKERELLNPKYI